MARRVFIGKYDPAKRPFPAKVERSTDAGPVGNSRNQRRQRAKLSFREQAMLAHSVGMKIPDIDHTAASPLTPAQERAWIEKWERQYAQR